MKFYEATLYVNDRNLLMSLWFYWTAHIAHAANCKICKEHILLPMTHSALLTKTGCQPTAIVGETTIPQYAYCAMRSSDFKYYWFEIELYLWESTSLFPVRDIVQSFTD